jgi:hypothetical protein
LREGSSGGGRPDFPAQPKSIALKAVQQQHQRVTAPDESKTRQRGIGGIATANLSPILSLRF